MPISTLGSYLPTMTQFSNHWTLVNVELGAPAPILFQGAYPLATFQTDRAASKPAPRFLIFISNSLLLTLDASSRHC